MYPRQRRRIPRFQFVLMILCAPAATANASGVDYGREIRPILSDHCFSCHGVDDEHRQAGLRLDRRMDATRELESGAVAILPGKPEESELVLRVESADEDLRMPPQDAHPPLAKEQIAMLRRWIAEGAPYEEHWAFSAPVPPNVPETKNVGWTRNDLDRFILARLEAEGLSPAAEADRYVLIRRLSLDLRGLPPSPEEVAEFVSDDRPDAYERLVDKFLDDPAYGERWARVWLDLARYADSKGYGSDPLRLTIWRYRDWVIDAFNRNLPFDEFTIQQLAGDLLPDPTPDQLLATAFHRNTMTNTEGGTDDEEFRVAAVKDRADTTGQIWMGLTFGCAKCHNHKFDPISQREYYQLYAIFNQSEDNDLPDDAPLMPSPTPEMVERDRLLNDRIAKLQRELDTQTPEIEKYQATWEEGMRAPAQWEAWKPTTLQTESGATIEVGSEGIMQVRGKVAANDTYTLIGELAGAPITAVRLETLPDDEAPSKGAGRAPDGNFVLSGLKAELLPTKQKEAKVYGRFVRIELPGKERILSLAEVQVFRGRINEARDKKATQSSTDFGGEAARAVDGNTEGHYFNASSTTHTRTEENPWWEVDLGTVTPIDSLTIWNRTDGAVGDRLANFDVLVLDESREEVWRTGVAAAPNPRVELDASGAIQLAIQSASADFEQQGFPISNVIDPARQTQSDRTQSGWAVGPKASEPHQAIFVVRPMKDSSEPKRLTIRLEHHYKDAGHTLGRFRISLSTSEAFKERATVPAEVLALVDKSLDQRSAEEAARLAAYVRSIYPGLDTVREEIQRLEKSREKPPMVPVMRELAVEKRRTTRLLEKGSFLSPGEEVGPGVPEVFPPMPSELPPNRLALAKWLVSPENPLTARVTANRFWARIFGKGIVESEEDFGTQGDLPTHPELLDWLATELVANGWDMKQFLRLLVTSATYRQSSRVTPALLEKDPRNLLYARMNRSRLEAEIVRDQALALAGLLSRKMYGPSVFPPQPDGLWRAAFNGSDRTWATSEGEDRYRRALYVFWRRTIPYPSLATFDAPSREICTIRRNQTNTPLQALVTLNDPVFVEAAQGLARRIVREGGSSTEERIRFGLSLCLARPARAEQVAPLARLYAQELQRYRENNEAAKAFATDPIGPLPEGIDVAELAAWTAVANVLLNLDGALTRG